VSVQNALHLCGAFFIAHQINLFFTIIFYLKYFVTMKKLQLNQHLYQSPSLFTLLFLTLLCYANSVQAQEDQLKKLMLANNCMACHMIDKTKYGPQFNEIGKKYLNDKSAVKKLAAKIKAGGSGVWGEDMMPPQPQVSETDAQTIAELILSLTPKE
jgi:cytochrome c